MSRLERIAQKATQAYGNDLNGLAHAQRLVNMATTESEKIVAWCHDLIEDAYATHDDVCSWGVHLEEEFAILLLTHNEKMTYKEYIDHILMWYYYSFESPSDVSAKGAVLALIVKQFDLFDHINVKGICTKHAHKLDRYLPALEKIVRAAAQKEEGWD